MAKKSVEMQDKKSAGTGKPSLQGGAAPSAWIIVPPRLEESFLERWDSALSEDEKSHKKMAAFDAHWESDAAVTDLTRNRSPFSGWYSPFRLNFFQWFLWRELRAYGAHLNQVVEINRSLRGCSETLAAAHGQFERFAARARLKNDLGSIIDLRLNTVEFEKDYWDKVFCVGSFASKYVKGWDDDRRKFPKMRPISGSIWFPELRQERNLDSTFQIRVGDLLRDYAPNPYGNRLSLLTISRLVLLVYICAELATDIEGHLIIWGRDSPRKLTVERTYETLRNAGLR